MILNISGIYGIRNNINGKIYIGSSHRGIRSRINSHKSDLRRGVHHNPYLQRSFNKNGESSFDFFTIEQWDDHDTLIEREEYWIAFYKASGEVYNIGDYATVPTKGRKLNETQRKSISERNRKYYSTQEGKLCIEKRKRIYVNRSPWTKEALAARKKKYCKQHVIYSPTGERFEIDDLTSFCVEKGLNYNSMISMLNGAEGRKQHRGWATQKENCLKQEKKHSRSVVLVNPNGEIITRYSINGFCKEFGLHRTYVTRLINAKIEEYKGWKRP